MLCVCSALDWTNKIRLRVAATAVATNRHHLGEKTSDNLTEFLCAAAAAAAGSTSG